jgi:hypothetical protein
MAIKSLQHSSLTDNAFYRSVLAGNDAFEPDDEDFLEAIVLSSSAASVTFSGLGAYSDYKHLQIRAVTRDTRAISGANNVLMTFNSDTGSNYRQLHVLKGDGSSVSSYAEAQSSSIIPFASPSANDTTNAFTAAVIDLLDAFSSNKYTTSRTLRGTNVAAAYATQVVLASGLWMNTASLTDISFAPISASFAVGSRFSIYGVRG